MVVLGLEAQVVLVEVLTQLLGLPAVELAQ